MANCGIDFIHIGKAQVSAGLLSQALKATKGIKNINAAVAKSYAIVKKTGVSLEEWADWYGKFNDPDPVTLNREDIFNDPKRDFDQRFQNLLNLVGFDTSDYIVGNYAKRVFNRVRSNLLTRGKGLTIDQIEVMQISLRSVLTKDKLFSDARKLRTSAKKNIKTKLGSNSELKARMEKVLALEPQFIPTDRLDTYFRLLQEFGQWKKVLTLREEGKISQDIDSLIQGIPESYFQKTEKAAKQVDDVPTEVMVEVVKSKTVDTSSLTNETEIKYAEQIADFTEEQLSALDNKQLQTLADSIDSVNNGVFPPALLDIINDLNANAAVEETTEHVAKVNGFGFDGVIARVKAWVKGGKKTAQDEYVRSSPLTNIDEFFNNKGRQIYNATFGKLASAYAKYETEAKGITETLNKLEENLQKKFKGNALVREKFKMKYYQMQREYESNPGKDVYAADEWIAATIEDENLSGFYTEQSIEILKEIQKEFAGKTAQEIHSSLSKEARNAISVMDGINESIVPKALFTAGVLRGEQVTMYNHYTHHNVINDGTTSEALASKRKEAFSSPGATKAGTVNERTEGVKAISFDPFYDFSKAARGLLLDYHMTPVNREVLRTSKRLETRFKKGNRQQKLATKALNNAIKEVLSNVFDASVQEYNSGDAFIEKVKKLGYQATLASVPRFFGELTSNAGFAMFAAPTAFASGSTTYAGISYRETSVKILDNVGSTQTGKLYESGISGSKHVEEVIGAQKRKQAQAEGRLSEALSKAKRIAGKVTGVTWTAKQVDNLATKLISTPDRMIARPLWFGVFAEAFKKQSGVDVDYNKIEAGDQAYLKKYAKEIKAARQQADQISVMAGATNNPFNGILKLQANKKDSGSVAAYKVFSGYLQRFLMYEYATAKTAVNSMVGNGTLTRRQGAGVMAGVMTRMTMYGVVTTFISNAIAEALGVGDDEEDYGKMAFQDFVGSALTLVLGRSLTAFPKIPINGIIENVNALFHEDYDPYKDSIVFSQIGAQDFTFGRSLGDWLMKLAGPYGAPLKGADYVWKDIAKYYTTKNEDKKQDVLDDLTEKSILQALGHAGLVPFFKDINKLYKKFKYEEKKKNKKKKESWGDDGWDDDSWAEVDKSFDDNW